MSAANPTAFDVEEGLIALPGTPERWIWAFTCPTPECGCRAAVVVSTPGSRESVLQRGRSIADAWRSSGHHGQAAASLADAVAFAVDLDTRDLFPPVGNARLEVVEHPAIKAIADRLDDDVLDAIARLWHRGKGKQPPADPGDRGATIAVEGWRPGDLVIWDDARPSLRGDTYVFGERIFDALELYCVEPDCDCGEVIVDFPPIIPRGAPHPGHAEFDGQEVTLHPAHARQRERLTELWTAYCRRYPGFLERFARRSAAMHGLAGRIVPAPSKPKAGRNVPCPCGSGKKHKKCCGAG
jgi:hypothetical protein